MTVESDKAAMDIPAPFGGIVKELKTQGRRQDIRRFAGADAGYRG
jgi:hypothetical protein